MKKIFVHKKFSIVAAAILICALSLSITALNLPLQGGKTSSLVSKIIDSQNSSSAALSLHNSASAGSSKQASSSSNSASSKTLVSNSSSSKSLASSKGASSSKSNSSSGKTTSYYITPSAPKFNLSGKIITGYYGGWAAYRGITPDKLNVSQLNILNYAFAKIGSDLRIAAGDPAVDLSNFTKLQSLKSSNPGLKTIISVGGWSYSDKFSDAALTENSRNIFADSVIDFIKSYGFDGVDIDWEYPTGGGVASNTSRAEDKTNFGLLMNALRAKLDAQGIKDGKHYILSFAGGTSSRYASGVGLSNISKIVDYGYIMTYDFHGPWDGYTDFNAPLYSPSGTLPQYKTSVSAAVSTWLSNGFPASKMVLGVPFYGYIYKGTVNSNNGLWQTYGSAAALGFDQICSSYLSNPAFSKHYDSTAQVPWIFDGSNFICYDDQNSIGLKAGYAASRGLKGVGAWDLSYDSSGMLISAIKNAIK